MKITLLVALLALSLTVSKLQAFTYTQVKTSPANFVTTGIAEGRINPAPQQTLGYVPGVPVVSATDIFTSGQSKTFSFSLTSTSVLAKTFTFTLEGGQTLSLPNVVSGNQLVVSAYAAGDFNECILNLQSLTIGTQTASPGTLFVIGGTGTPDYRAFNVVGFNSSDLITGSGTVVFIPIDSVASTTGINFDISIGNVVPEPSTTAVLGLAMVSFVIVLLCRRNRGSCRSVV